MRISVVIPAFNEEGALADCLAAVRAALPEEVDRHEIVLVDDGSTDGTWGAILDLVEADPAVRALRFTRNFGKERAIVAGLAESRGDAVIVLDADLQHPPELIGRMIELWREGARVVEAVKSRRPRETPWRRWSSRLYYRLFRWSTGFDLAGATDFKLLDREVVNALLALPERNLYFRGLTRWLGYRAATVPFAPQDRASGGGSRWSLRGLFGLAWGSLTAFSVLPLRLVTLFGVVMAGVAVVLGAQTLWYRARGLAEPGFPTVILLQLGIGSMVMIGIGMLGEYLGRIYEELKRRPHYVIDRVAGRRDRGAADRQGRPSAGADSP